MIMIKTDCDYICSIIFCVYAYAYVCVTMCVFDEKLLNACISQNIHTQCENKSITYIYHFTAFSSLHFVQWQRLGSILSFQNHRNAAHVITYLYIRIYSSPACV